MTRVLVLALLSATLLDAQQKADPDADKIVSVAKKYVSAEGLAHQDTGGGAVDKWIGVGREIGIATREGLSAVVDTSEKFGATRVGNFVMFMVAWKIMAREILGVFLGIPLGIAGICLWVWAMKRLFFGYRVLVSVDGKVKTYGDHKPCEFETGESRSVAACASFVSLAGWVIAMLIVIFAG